MQLAAIPALSLTATTRPASPTSRAESPMSVVTTGTPQARASPIEFENASLVEALTAMSSAA